MEQQGNTLSDDDQIDHVLPGEATWDVHKVIGRKEGRSKKAWVAGGFIGLVMLTCLGIVILVIAKIVIFGIENNDEWLAVSDKFMQAMAEKDIEEAQALFTEELAQEFKGPGLAAFLDWPTSEYFEGYIDLEIESYFVNYDYPNGTTIEIAGPVNYRGNHTGYFEFVLTEDGDGWKLLAFYVDVPPEKINSSAGQPRPNGNRTKQIPSKAG